MCWAFFSPSATAISGVAHSPLAFSLEAATAASAAVTTVARGRRRRRGGARTRCWRMTAAARRAATRCCALRDCCYYIGLEGREKAKIATPCAHRGAVLLFSTALRVHSCTSRSAWLQRACLLRWLPLPALAARWRAAPPPLRTWNVRANVLQEKTGAFSSNGRRLWAAACRRVTKMVANSRALAAIERRRRAAALRCWQTQRY